MDEILKLAKYLTLHIAAVEAKWDVSDYFLGNLGLRAEADIQKMYKIAEALEQSIDDYIKGGTNVLKS